MVETWKPIVGFENYEASSHGRIRNQTGRILKDGPNNRGYNQIGLYRDGKQIFKTVHQWVLLAFQGKPEPDQEVRHLNHDKTDNRLENLSYGTISDNRKDTRADGRGRGQKLLPADVIEIRKQLRFRKGVDIAKDFGISTPHVSGIKHNKKWR